MSKMVSSLRATACLPCPISTELQVPRSSASAVRGSNNSLGFPSKRNDPFLMFRELNRGWHSETMDATYLLMRAAYR